MDSIHSNTSNGLKAPEENFKQFPISDNNKNNSKSCPFEMAIGYDMTWNGIEFCIAYAHIMSMPMQK